MNSLGASSVSFSGSLYFVPWLVILSRFFGTAHASCYFPNGTDMNTLFPQDIYLPCNGGDVDSMCCALNRNFPDKCRSDGLCLSTFDGNAWRDGCTDRTWQSPKCVSLCNSGIGHYIAGTNFDRSTQTVTVTPCDDGSYCCGNGTEAQACCRKNNGLFVVNGKAVHLNADEKSKTASVTLTGENSLTSSTASTQSTASHTLSTATSATLISAPVSPQGSLSSSTSSPSASSSTKKSSNHLGAILGGTIGGIVAAVLLLGLVLFWRRRRSRSQIHHLGPQGIIPPREEKNYGLSEAPAHHPRAELDATVPLQELGDPRTHHEMR